MKLFDVPEVDVIEKSECTWCGAGCGELCRPGGGRTDLPGGFGTAHSQRWRDFWNATHPPKERVSVTTRDGFDDDMCPNCLTPWKCNGPHLT